MISLRQLLIIAVVIAGVWLLRRFQQQMQTGRMNPLKRRQKQAGHDEYQETVRCSQCGMFLLPADAKDDKKLGYRCHDERGCAQRVRSDTDAV